MLDVTIEDDRAVFTVEGFDKPWSFKSRVEIPLAHITDVEVNHDQVGALVAHGELVFWDVRDPASTIIVSLEHERYKKLIVEVADPIATAEGLKSYLPGRRNSASAS